MFTDVKNVLLHPYQCMKLKCTIGIVETKADSSFLLHHFLSYFLKENFNVALLSFCQSFNHFNSVGNKIGVNLVQAREQKNFLFIEGLKLLAHSINQDVLHGDNQWKSCVKNDGRICVKALYETIKSTIEIFRKGSDRKVVLLIDNLSLLTDTGLQVQDVTAFIHYLKIYLTEDLEGNLVYGLNNDFGEEDEEGNLLKKFTQHSVDLCVEVKGLETGYCKDVHGQVHKIIFVCTYVIY